MYKTLSHEWSSVRLPGVSLRRMCSLSEGMWPKAQHTDAYRFAVTSMALSHLWLHFWNLLKWVSLPYGIFHKKEEKRTVSPLLAEALAYKSWASYNHAMGCLFAPFFQNLLSVQCFNFSHPFPWACFSSVHCRSEREIYHISTIPLSVESCPGVCRIPK